MFSMKRFAALSLTIALIGAAPAASPAPAAPVPPGETRDAVTQQSLTLGGKLLPYTARAGTIVLQDAKGQPECRMFFTAYTLDGANPSGRPITFFYNGGPGSSTIWLRMGSFGPMRVQIPDAATAVNAPFDLVPNQYSLLDTTDMVFVDAPATGFSRIIGAGKPSDFFGVDQDMHAFSQFVSRYISTYGRWNSPKFLFGESYGTPRTAVVSNYLETHGIGLNGIVLLSAVLDFSLDWDVNFTPTAIGGGDWGYVLYLPTEAASSWYHNALPGPQTTLQALLPEVQQFAMGEYLNALAQGSKLSPSAYNAVVAKLHRYTGLSETYIRQSNLRIPYWRYTTELLRDSGKTVGRLDSRYTSYSLDRIADRPAFDATDSAVDAAFVGAGNYYLRQILHYDTPLEYVPITGTIFGQWEWKHNGNIPVNTAQDLANAMTFNPRMRVFVAGGYYDFATPYYAAMYTMNHLNLAPELQGNITYGFYESGHMVYLHPSSLQQFHDDLERWYGDVLRR